MNVTNKPTQQKQKHRYMKQTDSWQVGDWARDGEGINQKTFVHDPWIQIIIWGLTDGGVEVGPGGSRKKEKATVIA